MRLWHIVPACGSMLLLACGFADLFSSREVDDVVLTYTGPTAVTVGEHTPVAVTVSVRGAPIANPRLSLSSSDPTIVTFSADGDTIIAVSRGFDTLTIKLVASIFTDSFPTILQPVRVNP